MRYLYVYCLTEILSRGPLPAGNQSHTVHVDIYHPQSKTQALLSVRVHAWKYAWQRPIARHTREHFIQSSRTQLTIELTTSTENYSNREHNPRICGQMKSHTIAASYHRRGLNVRHKVLSYGTSEYHEASILYHKKRQRQKRTRSAAIDCFQPSECCGDRDEQTGVVA